MRALLAVSLAAAMVAVIALAVPAGATTDYAAKTGQPCTTCHSTIPALNATGETFKAGGYVWPIPAAPSEAPAGVPAPTGNPILTSVRVDAAPVLDGNGNDSAWAKASALEIPVTTFGIPKFNITIKSVYSGDMVYFLAQYPDSNYQVERSNWAYDASKKAWGRIEDDFGDEDEMGFFFNINLPNYDSVGCAQTCHGEKMVAPKGTTLDYWQFSSARANPMGWARDFRLSDDENADPAGGFTRDESSGGNRGYADNVQKLGGVEVPLYWKPYSGTGGVSVGDPRFLLQSEIDSGLAKKIVKADADGTLTDKAGNKVPMFTRIPGRILSAPSGPSWNDIQAKGAWMDGVWTVEFARKMDTGHWDDVKFDPAGQYDFDMYIKTRQPGESAHAEVPVSKLVFAQ
ncbi:MAG: ethylbenzene dehydrogenase-related protein [Chloroflexi bacterium]|nr:ethylbenzene dehydrogenase-related protein [Chloroflexota bacterium]